MSSMRVGAFLFSAMASLTWLGSTMPARAQEIANETSDVRHVYDAEPVWEVDADASVELRAPENLTVCRQGRIVVRGGVREAHMGCWVRHGTDPLRLGVPSAPGFLAVRSGTDLTWIGGGPVALHPGDILQVRLDDHLPIRIAGWVVFGLAVVAVAVGAIGLGTRRFSSDEGNVATLGIGAAALLVGVALAFVGDGFSISVAGPPPAD